MTKSALQLPEISMGQSVPRILHQHFLAGDAAIPEEIRSVRDALVKANPDWAYSFWDAARAEAFIADTYGEAVLRRYLRIRPEYYAARSDLLRYLTLYVEGGVYLDIKSTCDRPVDDAVFPGDRFLLMNWPMGSSNPALFHLPGGEYLQWCIVAVPGHPYLRAVIQRVLENIDNYSLLRFGAAKYGTLRLTGPVPYTLAIEQVRNEYPHTFVTNPLERGFVYSALGSVFAHLDIAGESGHYSTLDLPIVEGGSEWHMRLLRKVIGWVKRTPAANAFAKRALRLLNRMVT